MIKGLFSVTPNQKVGVEEITSPEALDYVLYSRLMPCSFIAATVEGIEGIIVVPDGFDTDSSFVPDWVNAASRFNRWNDLQHGFSVNLLKKADLEYLETLGWAFLALVGSEEVKEEENQTPNSL